MMKTVGVERLRILRGISWTYSMFKPALEVTTGGSLAGYNYVSGSSYKRWGAAELSKTLNFHDFLLRYYFALSVPSYESRCVSGVTTMIAWTNKISKNKSFMS